MMEATGSLPHPCGGLVAGSSADVFFPGAPRCRGVGLPPPRAIVPRSPASPAPLTSVASPRRRAGRPSPRSRWRQLSCRKDTTRPESTYCTVKTACAEHPSPIDTM